MLKKLKEYYKKYKNRWTLYLYLDNQCIKKLKVNDDYKPTNHLYFLQVYGLKRFFGTNRKVKIVVIPIKYKFSDNEKKQVHLEVNLYKGVDINA